MKRLIAAILCICLVFIGSINPEEHSYGEELALNCWMYSDNAVSNSVAKISDIIYMDGQLHDGFALSEVSIGGKNAEIAGDAAEWTASIVADENLVEGPLTLEVTYQDTHGVTNTAIAVTSGMPVIFDKTPPLEVTVDFFRSWLPVDFDPDDWYNYEIKAKFTMPENEADSSHMEYDIGYGWTEGSEIKILNDGTTQLNVRAVDFAGNGGPVKSFKIQKDTISPTAFNQDIRVLSSTAVEATMSVAGFDGDVAPIKALGYKFKIDKDDNTYDFISNWEAQPLYIFTGLEPNSQYSISSQTTDDAGNESLLSGTDVVHTWSNDPSSLTITERSNTRLTYVMDNSNQTSGTENKVRLSTEGGVVFETEFGSISEGSFSNLNEGEDYLIHIITRNKYGDENSPQLYWSGSTRHIPNGYIDLPAHDVYLKDGENLVLEGSFTDADGDDVSIGAFVGEVAGIVEVGSSTWSALWNSNDLPEGARTDIRVELSDDGGEGGRTLAWEHELTVDKTEPEKPSIFASPSSLTNDSVYVTLCGEEGSNIFYRVDSGETLEYESQILIEENAEIMAFQSDAAGNLSSQSSIQISWIDKASPTWSVVYSTDSPTNEPVVATLATVDENEVEITNNDGLNTYEFTTNGNFTFEFRDAAGNTGSATATVSCIDKTPPNAPVIQLSPQNGISSSDVKIYLSNEDESENANIEYCISNNGERKWLMYEEALTVFEKGTWDIFARATDSAGNVSLESNRKLVLKNKKNKEIEQAPGIVDHCDIRAPYLVAEGTTLDMSEIGLFYDSNGNLLDASDFVIESSDTNILDITEDGSIVAKNPGRAVLTISNSDAEVLLTVEMEIDESTEASSDVEFNDINNHWAEESIIGFRNAGYIRGYEDGAFRPQGSMTAAECLTVLERVRMDKVGTSAPARPHDEPVITAGDWSRFYCLSAFGRMDMDEVKGAFGEILDMDIPITRAQVALLLAQSENWQDAPKECIPFDDLVNHQYQNPILLAFNRGIINGYPDGSFRPDALITRAEMTVLFGRYIKHLESNEN